MSEMKKVADLKVDVLFVGGPADGETARLRRVPWIRITHRDEHDGLSSHIYDIVEVRPGEFHAIHSETDE